MEVNFSGNNKEYISIWPEEIAEFHDGERNTIKIIVNSPDLKTDIRSEGGLEPQSKTLDISSDDEQKIIESINNLKAELEKPVSEREHWTLTNNCATYVGKIFYESGVIQQKPGLIMTPRYIFYIVDKIEQQQYLRDLQTPSTKP